MTRPSPPSLPVPGGTDARSYDISGWAALRIVAVPVLITVAVVLFARALGDPVSALATFSTRFLGIFIEAAPFLLFGTLVAGLIEVFIDRSVVTRFVPRHPVPGTLLGAFLGFAFPVCECGVVPVTRRLFGKGLPLGVGVTFLLASPVMNPIVLLSTWSAFGTGPVLVGRFVITALVAVAVGLVFAWGARSRDVLRPTAMLSSEPGAVWAGSVGAPPDEASDPARAAFFGPGARTPLANVLPRLRAALALASDEFFDMGRFLVIGAALAAGMQTLVSQEALAALGRGPIASVLTMQVLAYVLSVCSTVDAFLALAFQGTFTTASILAFLTFGPMVDIKSTIMFLGVFTTRTVGYLILLPLLMTMAVGVWLNLNVPF